MKSGVRRVSKPSCVRVVQSTDECAGTAYDLLNFHLIQALGIADELKLHLVGVQICTALDSYDRAIFSENSGSRE